MSEALLHPAINNDLPEFEGFLEFLAVGDEIKEDFTSFLRQLHHTSADVWRPAACGTATFLAKSARRIETPLNKVIPKRFGFDHYWINVAILGQELVVDPYGIPEYGAQWETEPRLITPFFGIADLAQTDRHIKIYSNAQDGHRRFIA